MITFHLLAPNGQGLEKGRNIFVPALMQTPLSLQGKAGAAQWLWLL